MWLTEITENYYHIISTAVISNDGCCVMHSWSSRFVSVKSTTARSKWHREQRHSYNTGAMALRLASSVIVVAIFSAVCSLQKIPAQNSREVIRDSFCFRSDIPSFFFNNAHADIHAILGCERCAVCRIAVSTPRSGVLTSQNENGARLVPTEGTF